MIEAGFYIIGLLTGWVLTTERWSRRYEKDLMRVHRDNQRLAQANFKLRAGRT